LATHTLLVQAAAERPVICLIDDAQWVDRASMLALTFAARRILADPVLMVFAVRSPGANAGLDGLPELVLHGLDDRDARALLASVLPGRLDDRMRDNIIAEAAGNPLALLELHHALSPAALAGGYGISTAPSLTSRLEQTFGERLRQLPDATRTLLLIVAADPLGEPSWVAAAASRLGVDADAADAAEHAGLISVGSRIRFRHPLVRSAVYRHSSVTERRLTHAALAAVVDGPNAREHRAWHRAHAAVAPDEETAEELELAAERARTRGGVAAAAAFLTRAAELTPDRTRRANRALAAASAVLDAGSTESASRLLAIAGEDADDPLLGARSDLLRARLAYFTSRGNDAPPLLAAAAARLAGLDAGLARETYLEALMAAMIVGRLSTGAASSVSGIARAAQQAPPPTGRPRAVDLFLDGLVTRVSQDYLAGAPLLISAIDAYVAEYQRGQGDPRWHDITNRVSLELFDQDAYNRLAELQVNTMRCGGDLNGLSSALATSAATYVALGDFAKAAALQEEAEIIADAIGAPPHLSIQTYLAAYRGHERDCTRLIATVVDGATARGEGTEVSIALYAKAILHNGLGQYDRALDAAGEAVRYLDVGVGSWVLIELVEAAVRCGDTAAAADAAAQVVQRADACANRTAQAIAARCVALTTQGPAAADEYLRAIALFEDGPVVVYLARTHLVYGEWLRRNGKRAEARAQLRTAYDMFTRMGADGFAERARRELEAAGESLRSPENGSATSLTPQERYVTRLVREGLGNAEIASRLYISSRTVEWHLGRVFQKLGVGSRRELRRLDLDVG
jgi:DNA-binding CsgD family transcriptional regulator